MTLSETSEPDTCGFVPPYPGWGPCPRTTGHDGPCAHDPSPLTNVEAARLLGVHPNTIVNWKRSGTIPEFSRDEILRMRDEMWSQYAPATEIPDTFGPA